MLVVGGRTNSVNERLPFEVFNTETSEWSSFESLQRFRHGCWLQDKQLMIYGGFELSTPNVPTDSIYKVSLAKLFEGSPVLVNKLKSIDSTESMSSSSQSLGSKALEESSGMLRGQNTPNIKTSESQRGK